VDAADTWETAMDTLISDLRFGIRRLRRSPAFTAIAILSLGLGIGANTAIFSLVNAVLFQKPPLEEPERLLDIFFQQPDFSHGPFSYPDFRDMQADTRAVFTSMAAVKFALLQRDVGNRIESLTAEAVTGEYFTVRGLSAALGRLFTADDDIAPGGHPIVVLNHAYWRSAFAGDPGVIGQEMRLNGASYQIIGVAPEEYAGALRGLAPQLYVPMMMMDRLLPSGSSQFEERNSHSLFVTARLAPGVSEASARTALANVTQRFRSEYPDKWQAGTDILTVPTEEVIVNPTFDGVLWAAAGLLSVVVGLVLLIACANLAGFLLAQAQDRRKEIAIRLALGARRSSLMRQLLTETTALALTGGLFGTALSVWLLGALTGADLPLPFPITLDLAPDARVLAFTLLISMVAGVLFGLVPALQSTNPDVAPTLKDESAGGEARRVLPLRDLLVAGQMAASLVLLVACGLFVRSLQSMRNTDPGFGAPPAALVSFNVPADRYTEEQGRLLVRRALERIQAIPAVTAAGLTSNIHLNLLNTITMDVIVPGHEPPAGRSFFEIDEAVVDPGFFTAMGIPIVSGRNFDDAIDVTGAPEAVIVNQQMVELFWPGEDAIGRVFREDDTEYRIVGVTPTVKIRSLGEAPRPFIYRPYSQANISFPTFVVQTRTDAQAILEPIAATLRDLDPDIVLFEMKTLERHLATLLVPMRLGALVLLALATLALILAAIGLYGVVSYAVARRAREVGIRMALGADSAQVVGLMMRNGLRLVLAGGAFGLLLAVVLARAVSSLLFGVKPFDPVTFVIVPAALSAVAALAAWLPARRASRIDPIRALRS
jgi:predicted permease